MKQAERIGRLESIFKKHQLDGILVTSPANLYYFSGFRTTLYTRFNGLVLRYGKDPILITSYIDEQLAKKEIWGPVWVRDIRIHGPIQRDDVVPFPMDALKAAIPKAHRLGVDSISLALAREIEDTIPGVILVEISPELSEVRLRKEPEEIEKIKRASEIAIECLEKARELLQRPQVTELDIGAELEFEARRLGADGWGYPILISSGEKIAAPHSPPMPVLVPEDVPFFRIAFAPTFDGYTTSIIRTYCRKPNELTLRYKAAFFDAMSDLRHHMKAGVTVQEILRTVGTAYERHGVRQNWGGDMGYSVGVSVQEPPRIGGLDNTTIPESSVLAIMPGLRSPGHATFHHADIYRIGVQGAEPLCDRLQDILTY